MANAATAPLLTRSQEAPPSKEPSIDDVIEMYIGATGVMQLLKAVFVAFAWAFDAQQVFISAFTDAEPRWHCLTAASAGNASCSPAAVSPCDIPPGSWAWDRPAVASVVSEWALNCAGPALVSLPASSFFAGCLAGGFLLTTLADSLLGRKKMLLVSLASTSIAGVLTVFAPNIWAYAALRLVSGFFRSMVGTCTLVLSTELVGKRWRDTVNVTGFFCFAVGFLSLPALAYAFRDASWRNLYVWTSVPCLCYSVLVYFLVQESPRWLLVRGRKQDAMEALRQIMSLNGSCATATSFSMLDACVVHEDNAGASGGGVFATLQAMSGRRWALRRLAAIMATSFGVGMVYLGMPLNVGSLGSNLYLSVTYNALAELPSAVLAWLLIRRANRRSSVVALTTAAGACSLACAAVPRGAAAARMAAEVLSFFAACTAFDVMLVYSTELFPTSVRNSAVGLVRQALVLGGVAAPVLAALGRERSFWSFGLFGVAIGCCGLFVACLPETRGKSMSDTMAEEEERNEGAVASCTGATAGR
ncbi:organic cation/carnitine transporter 2-like [Panicum miliaceum]|uniref:H(+)/Pi cotransporter n=1 Tax=Panicum miliaceum TaxID=4540 RepID=A0A3L6S7H4_PANMI|nr:organic cation/carnitine transporter 2-like [Panicum miliaceum]